MEEDRKLTFGDHLEELRGHLLRSLLVVLGCACVALIFQDGLMSIVTAPHRVVAEGLQRQAEAAADADTARLEAAGRSVTALAALLREAEVQPARARDEEEQRAGLRSLAKRYERLSQELAALRPASAARVKLRFLTYQETIIAHLKLALLIGLLIGLPYVMFELWRFVREGLWEHEQRQVRLFVPISIACLVVGVAFAYFVLVPLSLRYLITYGAADVFEPAITLGGYLDLFFGLCLAMAVVFELPLVLVFMRMLGIVRAATLRTYRRYFILIAAVLAAVLTPPDPFSMGLVAVPLVCLYELGIIAVAVVERRSAARAAEAGPDTPEGASS